MTDSGTPDSKTPASSLCARACRLRPSTGEPADLSSAPSPTRPSTQPTPGCDSGDGSLALTEWRSLLGVDGASAGAEECCGPTTGWAACRSQGGSGPACCCGRGGCTGCGGCIGCGGRWGICAGACGCIWYCWPPCHWGPCHMLWAACHCCGCPCICMGPYGCIAGCQACCCGCIACLVDPGTNSDAFGFRRISDVPGRWPAAAQDPLAPPPCIWPAPPQGPPTVPAVHVPAACWPGQAALAPGAQDPAAGWG
mmetsp:Transcript_70180/g.219021  ORF Transcript_70180/g.219021 Transcript_70180/m.219021 type:complete len:253 (+) Transcript_70180:1040-1798(+)